MASSKPTLPHWRIALSMWLAGNALSPARYFCLPPNRVVEICAQVPIQDENPIGQDPSGAPFTMWRRST